MDPEQLPLRDLHLPEAVGWWPLAPGWWLLIALLVFGVAYFIYQALQKWQRNAARRLALRELSQVHREYKSGLDPVTLAVKLSELVRRTMLAYAPRDEVAGLTGRDWLKWLDRGLDEKPFSEGSGRILESLPYLSREVVTNDVDLDGLLQVVKARLQTPPPSELA